MSEITLAEMISVLDQAGYTEFFPQIPGFSEDNENICFACSPKNTEGLQMHFYSHPDHDWIVTPFIISQKYCGYPIYAHGGILTTLTDEVMSHVINLHKNCYAVTYELTMRFFKPIFIGKPIFVVGRFNAETQKGEKVIFDVQGDIYSGMDLSFNGPGLVQGKAKWMQLSETVLLRMKEGK